MMCGVVQLKVSELEQQLLELRTQQQQKNDATYKPADHRCQPPPVISASSTQLHSNILQCTGKCAVRNQQLV